MKKGLLELSGSLTVIFMDAQVTFLLRLTLMANHLVAMKKGLK
jgi:hypothetical protein